MYLCWEIAVALNSFAPSRIRSKWVDVLNLTETKPTPTACAQKFYGRMLGNPCLKLGSLFCSLLAPASLKTFNNRKTF